MKCQLSMLAINKALRTFQICGKTRKYNSDIRLWPWTVSQLKWPFPAKLSLSLSLPSTNLYKIAALDEGKPIQMLIPSSLKKKKEASLGKSKFMFKTILSLPPKKKKDYIKKYTRTETYWDNLQVSQISKVSYSSHCPTSAETRVCSQ